jgi:DNA-binding transcriptional ArsR family regulator
MGLLDTLKRKPASERKRGPDEALSYSIGYWIRLEALAILAEGKHSVNEVAEIIGEDVKLVGNHIRDLYDSGCIEEAGTAKVRNATEHFYRAVTLPHIPGEAYRAMSMEERHDAIGIIIQAILAEVMASYRARKLETDEDVWLGWDCFNFDEQGEKEAHQELDETFERLLAIKGRSANRLAKAGETGTNTIISMMGYERSRPGRPVNGYRPRQEDE